MFVDEVKVYAQAGHGGKGAIAFRREAYITKGGPEGGNGGRGGSVILEASHDLNNLIEQFFNSRLVAPRGEGGMGKGMDGKAGKDIVIKVPCGTMVWLVKDTTPTPEEEAQAAKEAEEAAEAGPLPAHFPSSTGKRPIIRSSAGARGKEIDLSTEKSSKTEDTLDATKGELVCDLTENGQRFILCQGGRGGLGNRNFATARQRW